MHTARIAIDSERAINDNRQPSLLPRGKRSNSVQRWHPDANQRRLHHEIGGMIVRKAHCVRMACTFLAFGGVWGGDFEVWEPVPFRRQETSFARQTSIAEGEAMVMTAGLEVKEWMRALENRSREINCRKENFRRAWADQEVAVLHLMVFRLVQIQATAALAAAGNKSLDAYVTPETKSDVEVIICIQNLEAVAGDIPTNAVLRASTVLPITNICREREVAGTAVLQQLARFFAAEAARDSSRLYLVVLAKNAFFNDQHGKAHHASSAEAVGAAIVEKYRRILREDEVEDGKPRVIVGTDRTCRRGQYKACEEAQSPPYLTDTGLLGSAEALELLIAGLLAMAPAGIADLGSLLRRAATLAEVRVVPDHQQLIFGSLTEVTAGSCADQADQGNWCAAASPCCPISNDFRYLHEAFYARYIVKECRLVQKGKAPVLWSGDGISKWMYLLALDSLAMPPWSNNKM
ncbi:unnamed protein product [Effrenium voratum]|nr:unnamed protein product [Effrenium voratum]